MSTSHTRRAAVGALARLTLLAVVAPGALPRLAAAHWSTETTHPDPRPGVTGERVLPAADVPEKYQNAYRAAREIPHILDGLHCYCDCAAHRGKRSLLSCFESAMPQSCGICLGEARLARRLDGRGQTLAEIRVAVDRSYGGRRDDDAREHAHHGR